jgi:serine/threonine protein kinase
MVNDGVLLASREYYETVDHVPAAAEYLQALRDCLPADWTVARREVWLGCRPPVPIVLPQGFKIHVSATPFTAEATLRRVAPQCLQFGAVFKCAASPQLLGLLMSKHYARGGGSKFMTIYPPAADVFESLIESIHSVTADLDGPYILSDKRYSTSRVVFYRYGGFQKMTRLNADGTRTPVILNEAKEWIEDTRTPYFTLPSGVDDPFPTPAEDESGGGVVLNQRFEIARAVGFTNSGGVYLASDLSTGKDVIVKEARPLTNFWATESGWLDAATLLRHEHDILRQLEGTCVVRALDFFKEWEHWYLVETLAQGEPLRRARARDKNSVIIHLHRDPLRVRAWLARFSTLAREILAALDEVHARGVVLGDLSPNNVFVDPDTYTVQIIDVESAIGVGEPAIANEFASVWATAGFRAPARRERKTVTQADDLFSVGMMLFSTILPTEAQTAFDLSACDRFLELFDVLGLPPDVRQLIVALRNGECDRARAILRNFDPERADLSRLNPPVDVEVVAETARSLAEGIADHMLSTTDAARSDRLWPANPAIFGSNPLSIANGACGNLLFLSRLGRPIPDEARQWLSAQPISVETYPPGLYTGLSGIAYTRMCIGQIESAREALEMAHRSPLLDADPTMYQGSAGVGFADLYFFAHTRDSTSLDRAVAIADRLISFARRDANGTLSWPTANQQAVPLGFAYGASGIALFLLYAGLASNRDDIVSSAQSALEFDVQYGTWREERLVWGDDTEDISNRPYWLRGTAGVGAALVRFYSLLGEKRYLQLAGDAALGSYSLLCAVPTQFEGLSGIGELQLDLFVATGDPKYRDAAARLVRTIEAYAMKHPAGIAIPGRTLDRIATDFGWGGSGVGAFLVRLAQPGPRILHDIPGLLRPSENRMATYALPEESNALVAR